MTTERNLKSKVCAWAAAAALAAAAAGGCKSSGERDEHVDRAADNADQNRMLVRMALAENVYNGVAAERAVYPKDFDPGSAALNRLGTRRVEMLIDASRQTTTPIVVVRGDASDDLYAARVEAVRKHLVDAGLSGEEVPVARDTHVGGGPVASHRALMTYDRLMATYGPNAQGGAAANGSGASGANRGIRSNNSSR